MEARAWGTAQHKAQALTHWANWYNNFNFLTVLSTALTKAHDMGVTIDKSIKIIYDKHPDEFRNGQSVFEGDPLPEFHEYVIDLNWETTGRDQPLVFGDNELAVKLVPTAANTDGKVSIEELECYVYVRKPKPPR